MPSIEPMIGPVPALLDVTDKTLPLQRYLLTRDQVRGLDRARITRINACLGSLGVDGGIDDPPQQPGPSSITERRYGLTDATLAAAHGYTLGVDPGSPPPPPDLGADGDVALFGTAGSMPDGVTIPTGGCLGEANRELEEVVPAGLDENLAEDLANESYAASMEDSRVTRALGEWSRCMADQGYDYPDSLAPFQDPALGDGDTDLARRVAIADVDCKERTNLVGTWFTVESAYQEWVIAANADALRLVRAALDAQLEWARTVGAR